MHPLCVMKAIMLLVQQSILCLVLVEVLIKKQPEVSSLSQLKVIEEREHPIITPSSDYITIKNCDVLAEVFEKIKAPYVKGRVWTTDSMLRETKGLVAKRKGEGCIAVEMELAGVQAICDFYGLELYDFLEAGDVLGDSGYEFEGLHDANHNVGKALIALEAATYL